MHIENENCPSGAQAEILPKPSAVLFAFLVWEHLHQAAIPGEQQQIHCCEFVTVNLTLVCTKSDSKAPVQLTKSYSLKDFS